MKCPGAATFLQLGPDFPDAKITPVHIHVVEKHDATRPDFWQPGVDVVTDRGFSMKAVDVEKVDALGLKFFARVVEAGTDQGGERFVMGAIMHGNLCKRRLIIVTGMLIATPRIDPKTSGARFVFYRRLAEGEITFPPIHAQLDEHAGLERGDEIVGEVQMVGPRSHSIDAWFEVTRGQICATVPETSMFMNHKSPVSGPWNALRSALVLVGMTAAAFLPATAFAHPLQPTVATQQGSSVVVVVMLAALGVFVLIVIGATVLRVIRHRRRQVPAPPTEI